MRSAFLAALLIATAAPVSTATVSADIRTARAEWAAAEAESRRLEGAAAGAADEAARLSLERQAAAAAIAAAEARISAVEAELRLREEAVEAARNRLAKRQAPVAGLVTALVNLERRPPLLALADGSSVDELVRTQALLASVLPHVRKQSTALTVQLTHARQLAEAVRQGRGALLSARIELDRRQQRFAALERRALDRSQRLGVAALEAGDTAIAASVGLGEVERAGARAAEERRIAARLAALPPAPARPFATNASWNAGIPAYVLPAASAIRDGHGTVGESGIRERGVRLATRRGTRLIMPADGTIVFTGPYRSHDGVVILDHGDGWMTMLVGARAEPPRGSRLKLGQPLGVALGEMTVELSRGGTYISPALAAHRRRSLSIQENRR